MARPMAEVLLVTALAVASPRDVLAASAPLPATMVPAETIPWVSADGWQGWIRHYPGPGAPVLLVHGMAANHENFDFRPEVSLASYLVDAGWDVWVPDLRGDPGTLAPTRAARLNYTFDDCANQDVPAILDAVTGATGATKVAWVGHSMGGMLLYATLTRSPERISEGVAIASPTRFTVLNPLRRDLRSMGGALGRRGLIRNTELVGVFGGVVRSKAVLSKLSDPAYLDGPTLAGLSRTGIADLPREMVQEVRTWLKAGTLTHADGVTPWVSPAAVPVLALAGEGDWLAPAVDVTAACDVLPQCEAHVLGPSTGLSHPYGHLDLVLGTTSRAEIYPIVGGWLTAHRARAATTLGAGADAGINP